MLYQYCSRYENIIMTLIYMGIRNVPVILTYQSADNTLPMSIPGGAALSIGWGFIGTGRHPDTKVAPAISGLDGASLAAAYSRDMRRAETFAAKHGVSAAYDSLAALLEDPKVDIVFIATPNRLHAEHTVAAAQAGKHVLVEKPMAVGVAEAQQMVRVCRDAGVTLGVAFQLRTHPAHQEMRSLVENGTLGVIPMVQAQWGTRAVRGQVEVPPRTGLSTWWDNPDLIGRASTMMGTGVHAIDLLHYILGQEVVEVAAISDGQTAEKPLEQTAALALRFRNGTIGTMCCGRRMPDSRNDAVVYGTSGRAIASDSLWEGLQGNLEVVSDTVNLTRSYQHDPLGLFRMQAQSFQHAVETGRAPSATGVDGLRVVQVTSAMIESATTGRSVRIGPLEA